MKCKVQLSIFIVIFIAHVNGVDSISNVCCARAGEKGSGAFECDGGSIGMPPCMTRRKTCKRTGQKLHGTSR